MNQSIIFIFSLSPFTLLVFCTAQKDLSSLKSLAVYADNLASKVGRLNFQ